MSNSPLVTYTNLSPNCTRPRRGKIRYITIHCIVGQWTARQGCDYFTNPGRGASANYVVGKDGSIGLSVPEEYRAWTTGGVDSHGNPIRVNGISGADNDHNAITIETACDTFAPYAVTDAAYQALIKLVADIARRNGMGELRWQGDKSLVGQPGKQNLTVHRWFAYTGCPGDYLYEHMGDIAERANRLLQGEEEKELTEKEVRAIVRDEYARLEAQAEAERAKLPASGWAESILPEAMERGITDGTRPKSRATREEVAAMVLAALR